MPVRSNILTDTTVRDQFLDACVALDEASSGVTASQVASFVADNFQMQMRGIEQDLSYYDLMVLWHVVAMSIGTPPGSGRNAAHRGPIFLPWHRTYMIQLENWMQIVLDDDDFGLPYWDWAEDGNLPTTEQWQTTLWTADYLGEARNVVQSGRAGQLRVRLWQDDSGVLWSINGRPLERNAGRDSTFRALPTTAEVSVALMEPNYDLPPYDAGSAGGHRNRLEGWINGPALHNLVHVWVGGDMAPGTSPNDPVFFLNHCNVDRIWEAWMAQTGPDYAPVPGEGPDGHELDDAMVTLLGPTRTPQQVLDPSQWYEYDSLTVS